MIFVDTSAWYAAYVAGDPEHALVSALLARPGQRLLTTDYVIDETLTLLVARGERPLAKVLGRILLAGRVCEIAWTAIEDFQAAWQVFWSFDDKAWSFTDCLSYVVMKNRGITEAFALDEHFQQFGFVNVKP